MTRLLRLPIDGGARTPACATTNSAVLLNERDARMYHYNPQIALEEVKEEAILPQPVHVRDMMLRAHLSPDRALELNRKFQTYLEAFGEAQELAGSLLQDLATVRHD